MRVHIKEALVIGLVLSGVVGMYCVSEVVYDSILASHYTRAFEREPSKMDHRSDANNLDIVAIANTFEGRRIKGVGFCSQKSIYKDMRLEVIHTHEMLERTAPHLADQLHAILDTSEITFCQLNIARQATQLPKLKG